MFNTEYTIFMIYLKRKKFNLGTNISKKQGIINIDYEFKRKYHFLNSLL